MSWGAGLPLRSISIPVWISASCSVLSGKSSLFSPWYHHAFCTMIYWNSPNQPFFSHIISVRYIVRAVRNIMNRLVKPIYIQKNPGNKHSYILYLHLIYKKTEAGSEPLWNSLDSWLGSLSSQTAAIKSCLSEWLDALKILDDGQFFLFSFKMVLGWWWLHILWLWSLLVLCWQNPHVIWMLWKRYFIYKVHFLFYIWTTFRKLWSNHFIPSHCPEANRGFSSDRFFQLSSEKSQHTNDISVTTGRVHVALTCPSLPPCSRSHSEMLHFTV